VVIESDPASTMLFVRHREGVSLGTVRIVSVLGHTVATADADGTSQISMDIRALGNGVYFLVGENGVGQWSSRLQITR
jgi:hypothetical protein